MKRLWRPLLLLPLALMLSGFTGNVGPESEFYAGVGIGRVNTTLDSDNYAEAGGTIRYKFRHFPYDDIAAWVQFGASWTTYPTGGNFGNQIWTIQYMGGIVKNFGEFGGGFVLSGDQTGVGPLWVRTPSWVEKETMAIEGLSGTRRFAGAYLFVAQQPAGVPLTLRYDLTRRQIVLKHRTRDIRVRLRGDAVEAMDNFGADLTFFDSMDD